MAVTVGDLDSRQLDRLRVALAEAIAANFAYPPLFNYRTERAVMRPLEGTKQEQISDYLHSVNFGQLDRTDVRSPEMRRFVERLFLRYIEVNPDLNRPRFVRYQPEMRARVPKVAAALQRGLTAFIEGQPTDFGSHAPQRSWAADAHPPRLPEEELDHRGRILETALLRARTDAPLSLDSLAMPAVSPSPSPQRPAGGARNGSNGNGGAARPWGGGPNQDATVPVPARGFADAFGASNSFGASSALGRSSVSRAPAPPQRPASPANPRGYDDTLADQPTGYLPSSSSQPTQRNGARSGYEVSDAPTTVSPALAPDLAQMYSDYLEDMQPEIYRPSRPASPLPSAPPARPAGPPLTPARPSASSVRPPAQPTEPPIWNSAPARPLNPVAPPPQVAGGESHRDNVIFSQLRYQLEGFIRMAARSYGIGGESPDPSSVLDALRRSGFVDEGDLTIAEGILALSERVANNGMATVEDYRQAMTLYLLYHRSHLRM